MGGRDRRGRFRQHRPHRRDRARPGRAGRADSVRRLRRPAQSRHRGMPARVDLQPRFRRALHARGPRRDPVDPVVDARARRLSGAAPQLHDGALDQGLGLVSEFSPAAALPQGRDALRQRSRARRLRAPDAAAARPIAKRDLAVPVPQPRGGHQQDEPLLLARRAQARRQARVDGGRARARHLGIHQALPAQARLPRRLGGFRHRAGKFRRHILPLRQALRGDAGLGAAAERAVAAAGGSPCGTREAAQTAEGE